MRRRRAAAAVVVALLGAACWSEGADLTDSGKGKPSVTVDFPETVPDGSTRTATLEVRNPGPGDMDSLFVSFSLVGVGGTEAVPAPLVAAGAGRRSPSIVAVDPRPASVASGGTIYRFGGLPEGESATLRFRRRAPREPGVAANSVTAYAGEEPDRARGVLLETRVEG